MKQPRPKGFTLIEVMIAVAVIAILAAVAYPSYRDSVIKGKRAEGRTALSELLLQQERYNTQRNCYLGFTTSATGVATPTAPSPSTACGGVTAPSVPFKPFSGSSLATSAYLLSADLCPAATGVAGATLSIAECVRLVATPRGSHVDPDAGELRVTTSGTRDCTGTKASVSRLCWQ